MIHGRIAVYGRLVGSDGGSVIHGDLHLVVVRAGCCALTVQIRPPYSACFIGSVRNNGCVQRVLIIGPDISVYSVIGIDDKFAIAILAAVAVGGRCDLNRLSCRCRIRCRVAVQHDLQRFFLRVRQFPAGRFENRRFHVCIRRNSLVSDRYADNALLISCHDRRDVADMSAGESCRGRDDVIIRCGSIHSQRIIERRIACYILRIYAVKCSRQRRLGIIRDTCLADRREAAQCVFLAVCGNILCAGRQR